MVRELRIQNLTCNKKYTGIKELRLQYKTCYKKLEIRKREMVKELLLQCLGWAGWPPLSE